ncbi:HEAT repeat domain-containing protein [Singulisphaera sp. Ch08]|uniref:HEAT repeat domain-containing protein n=1 Tax=Singulisphaera sp. Ch08 TaxID=3120278 RepID=A0AAU7CRC0_9BACT
MRKLLWVVLIAAGSTAGCVDPVTRLVNDVRTPVSAGSLEHYVTEGPLTAVNRSGQGDAAAAKLIPLLKDNDISIREGAVGYLGGLQADSRLVVPVLIEAYADPQLRISATGAFGRIGPVDEKVVATLILALKDENPRVRDLAIKAFQEMGPRGAAAVPALTDTLSDKILGNEAAQALGRIGHRARPAVLALTEMAKSAKGYDRLHAAVALWDITQDPDIAVPALTELLKDSFLPLRRAAAIELGTIGPAAHAAIPALILASDLKQIPRAEHPPLSRESSRLESRAAEPYDLIVRSAAIEALRNIQGNEPPNNFFLNN